MKIITGCTGELHVTSDDDRHLHAGTFGKGKYILSTASKLNATNPSSNVVRLAKGDIIFQGCHARIEDYEDVEINPGTEGYSRIDLICCQYKKVGGVESTELVVYTGTPATSNPTIPTPTYESNNILDGAEIADMILYKVTLTNVNITKIERIAELSTGLDDVYRKSEVYNKTETDDKLKGKSNLSHNHDGTYIKKSDIKSFKVTMTGDGTPDGVDSVRVNVPGFTQNSVVLDVVQSGEHLIQSSGWIYSIKHQENVVNPDGCNVTVFYNCSYETTDSATVYFI